MAPRTSWSNLQPGLIALVALVLLAVSVLVFANVGEVRGDTMQLFVRADQARGLMKGSEVWLEGQKIGVVERIGFLSPASDSAYRVVIEVTVREEDAAAIRRDSRVQVRSGTSVVGAVVVYVSAGTPASPPARGGDTLIAVAKADVAGAMTDLKTAMKELGPLKTDARAVAALARSPDGSIGAARVERGGAQVRRLRANIASLRESAGRLRGGPSPGSVMSSARAALARVDSIRALLRADQYSLGRFRRDSTLGSRVAELRDELGALRASFRNGDGTLGRFSRDSAIAHSLAAAQSEMTLLFADMKRRPLRYLSF
jgi:phospholipid/cholesterol/gamma-HCH transport system substrate-binding protein